MRRTNGFSNIFIIILIFAIGLLVYFLYLPKLSSITERIVPIPTPYQFPYKAPTIAKNRSYRIVIVGDSIVNSLGLNANVLRNHLISLYPDSEFVTYNYGYPSTNVLSLYDRLTKTSKIGPTENQPILSQGFELIIIESFGYNPLSEYILVEGLKKQNEELEKSVREILRQKPNAALAFLTPIALDSTNFARGTIDLTPEARKNWVIERVAYINNHKRFAEEKGIPVIDVYLASLKPDGIVDKIYISEDNIHPSKAGIDLISKTIAEYIFNNKIFPE